MALQDPTAQDGTIEEGVDEINDFVATHGRYPPAMLAVAMRVHLESLLRTLFWNTICQEIRGVRAGPGAGSVAVQRQLTVSPKSGGYEYQAPGAPVRYFGSWAGVKPEPSILHRKSS
jgi:hypothetical protein